MMNGGILPCLIFYLRIIFELIHFSSGLEGSFVYLGKFCIRTEESIKQENVSDPDECKVACARITLCKSFSISEEGCNLYSTADILTLCTPKCTARLQNVYVLHSLQRFNYNEVTNVAKHKNASQSSTMGKSAATFAVDGQIQTVFDKVGYLCAMTAAESCYLNPWWQVDLGTEHVVHRLIIYAPGGIYSDWMRYFIVRVGNLDMEDLPTGKIGTQNPLCYEANEGIISHSAPIEVTCSAYGTAIGRYVSIQKIGTTLSSNIGLTLCEVEIFGFPIPKKPNVTNVAYLMPTSSSTNIDTSFLAVDGYITKYMMEIDQKRCTDIGCSDDDYPWWRVDLIDEHVILSVALHNQRENYHSYLHNISVQVGTRDINHIEKGTIFVNNSPCYHLGKEFSPGPTQLTCPANTVGRYVSIQIIETSSGEGDWNVLNLCEVEVFGYRTLPDRDVFNVALKKPCRQSSTEGEAYAGFANDGIRSINFGSPDHPQCSETNHFEKDHNPWWRVDLGSVHIVKYVTIYNRNDFEAVHFHDVRIIVGYNDIAEENNNFWPDAICTEFRNDSLPMGKSVLYCSKPMKGKFVTVEMLRECCLAVCKQTATHWQQFLSICEIEVWGYPLPTKSPIVYDAAWNLQLITSDDYKREIEFNEVTPNKSCDVLQKYICPKTNDDGYDMLPWFRIDLVKEHLVKKVTLFNDMNAKNTEMKIEIRVGNDDIWHHRRNAIFDKNYLCARVSKYSFSVPKLLIECEQLVVGIFVSIQAINPCPETKCHPGLKTFLSICHVQVWGMPVMPNSRKRIRNLALSQPTEQSTLHQDGSPALAVDGDLTLQFIHNNETKCSHTEMTFQDFKPWWKVDLMQPSIIEKIVIYNTNDEAYSKSLHDLEIRIGFDDIDNVELNEKFYKNQLCVEVNNRWLQVGKNELLCNQPVEGRYVVIQIVDFCKRNSCDTEAQNVLILCEVEVWGEPKYTVKPEITNIAFCKPTFSSSSSSIQAEQTAVDGIKTTIFKSFGLQNCFSTDVYGRGSYPWWMVDLINISVVKKVIIYNQQGQLQQRDHDLDIRVGNIDVRTTTAFNSIFTDNLLCTSTIHQHLLPGPTVLACEKEVSGRYVSIQIVRFCKYEGCRERLKNVLVLCEVEVWGYPVFKQYRKELTLTDVAVGKPIEQSSLASKLASSLSLYEQHQCEEQGQRYPWWQVKFDDEKSVTKLTVYFKTKNSEIHHHNFQVRVGKVEVRIALQNKIFTDNDMCVETSDLNVKLGATDIHCPLAIKGTVVSVQMTTNLSCSIINTAEHLVAITRIAVWVTLGKNPLPKTINAALLQPALQSSTSDDQVASYAVDGKVPSIPEFTLNNHHQCSKTMFKADDFFPWWRVDLKDFYHEQYVVKSVVLYHGGAFLGRFHDVEVRIGNVDIDNSRNATPFHETSLCGIVEGPILNSQVEVRCGNLIQGRYVSIQITGFCKSDICRHHTGNILSLCEVEVWTLPN